MQTFSPVAVVGMHFRGSDAKTIAAGLPNGQALRIEREPDNQYDSNAIKVFYEDMFIGYLEATQAAWIAPNIDVLLEDELDGAPHTEILCTVIDREVRGKNTHPIVCVSTDPEAWKEAMAYRSELLSQQSQLEG